ncbi:hypothetical protein BC830DRAFT_1127767 [Chytriomyces sp. MP71]|nr:hypothetical protein BC830DRAFT_1127767 [Chytriomyces sp. MP71]
MAEQLMLQQTMLMKAIDYSLVYALHSFVANMEGQVHPFTRPCSATDDQSTAPTLSRYACSREIH